MSNPLTIENVTFTWSEEHGHWCAGELVLRQSEGKWRTRTFGATNTTYSGAKNGTPERLIECVRDSDPDFAAEFARLQQSQQREQNESAVELLDQWKREDALPTPAELYEQRPERFEAWGLVWRRMRTSPVCVEWRSGELAMIVFNDDEVWIGDQNGPDLQSAYDAAVAAGVDFSGCERVGRWIEPSPEKLKDGLVQMEANLFAAEAPKRTHCPTCDRPFIDPYVIRAGHCSSCVECTTTFSHRTPSRAFTVDTPPPRPDTLSTAAKWHIANTSHSGEKPGWEE